MELESWQLSEFNLVDRIVLDNNFGLLNISRSEDGTLILVTDGKYGQIDQTKATPVNLLNPDSLLGFVLDIGIQRNKILTRGNGYYFGQKISGTQSDKVVSQKSFNKELFKQLGDGINGYYQSGDKQKIQKAIKLQISLDQYNRACLLFPNFYAESYLALMQLLDGFVDAGGGYDFASSVALISSTINKDVYAKLTAVDAYKDRLQKAKTLFSDCLFYAEQKTYSCCNQMKTLDDAGKVCFACFFSAYQYRNEFVHRGFPFPDTVKGLRTTADSDAGMMYLGPACGCSHLLSHRPGGLIDSDLLDIHEIVPKDVTTFKDVYFLLLPSWYFLKRLVRETVQTRARGLV